MRKNTLADVDSIVIKCPLLNALQLHKLLSNYHNEDFDESVPSIVIKTACSKRQAMDESDTSGSSSPANTARRVSRQRSRRGSIAAMSPPFQLPMLSTVKRYALKENASHKGIDTSFGKRMVI